jgi:hypothetical protein
MSLPTTAQELYDLLAGDATWAGASFHGGRAVLWQVSGVRQSVGRPRVLANPHA